MWGPWLLVSSDDKNKTSDKFGQRSCASDCLQALGTWQSFFVQEKAKTWQFIQWKVVGSFNWWSQWHTATLNSHRSSFPPRKCDNFLQCSRACSCDSEGNVPSELTSFLKKINHGGGETAQHVSKTGEHCFTDFHHGNWLGECLPQCA